MAEEPDIKEMQEKIKSMSPEELREFQKQQCIFCHIVNGRVQSRKVYEDDICMAVLDINPANPGHLLVVPKEHFAIMPVIPESTTKHLFMIAKQLSKAVLQALQAQGTTIFVANGVAAGQKAQHFMIHIIPRMEGDGIGLIPQGKKADLQRLKSIRTFLREKIYKDMGVADPESHTPTSEHKYSTHHHGSAPSNPAKHGPPHATHAPVPIQEAEKSDTDEDEHQEDADTEEQEQPKKQQKWEDTVTLDDIAKFITGKK